MSPSRACTLEVDHVGVLGPSIRALAAAWERLGFRVVGPEELMGVGDDGEPRGMGQFSAHVMFPDDYIELTAVEKPAPEHHLAQFRDAAAGLRLLILGTNDIDARHAACASAGLAPAPVQRAAREIH